MQMALLTLILIGVSHEPILEGTEGEEGGIERVPLCPFHFLTSLVLLALRHCH